MRVDRVTASEDLLHPGDQVGGGRYEIKRRLGRGGMGAVYEGVHLELGKRVAIKTLRPEYARSPQIRARFLREGQAASRIRHPHAADVSDVGSDGDLAWLAMEFLEGEDLNALLERERVLPLTRIADLLVPVLAALSTAHEEGIVHRDIKPGNIFLARGRHGMIVPKLLDFGISKVLSPSSEEPHDTTDVQSLTGTNAILGSPYYMAPEQVLGARNATALSDVYAMGVILYRALTGQLPFKAEEVYPTLRAIEIGVHVPPRQHVPDMPPRVDAMIRRAMHRDPSRRFSSAHDLGAELLQYASPALRAQWTPIFGEAPAEFEDVPAVRPLESIASTAVGLSPSGGVTTLGGSAIAVNTPPPPGVSAPPAQKPHTKLIAAGVLGSLVVAAATVAFLKRAKTQPATPTAVMQGAALTPERPREVPPAAQPHAVLPTPPASPVVAPSAPAPRNDPPPAVPVLSPPVEVTPPSGAPVSPSEVRTTTRERRRGSADAGSAVQATGSTAVRSPRTGSSTPAPPTPPAGDLFNVH